MWLRLSVISKSRVEIPEDSNISHVSKHSVSIINLLRNNETIEASSIDVSTIGASGFIYIIVCYVIQSMFVILHLLNSYVFCPEKKKKKLCTFKKSILKRKK